MEEKKKKKRQSTKTDGGFPKKVLKSLRYDVPAETPELMNDGWANLTTLREGGIEIDEESGMFK